MRRTAREIPVKVSTPEKWLHVRIFTSYQKASYYLSKFWRTTMQKKANGQTPAEILYLFCKAAYFSACVLNLIFIPYRGKLNLNFTPNFLNDT